MSKLIQLLASNKTRPKAVPLSRIEAKGDETTIYLYDSIVADEETAQWWGGVSAEALVPAIRAIKGGTINLRINSPGGDVFAAQAICQAIRETSAKVVAHVDGYAASAATVIATAADEVRISEGAMYMIHCGWTMAMGNAEELRSTAGLLDKVDATMCAQYARKTGLAESEVLAMMQAETWFTAQEAVDKGFANAISASPKVAAAWDMSAYANAPQMAIVAKKKKMGPMKMVAEADGAYLSSMIEHHGMAIQMSRDLIVADPETPLRDFAERIIEAQAGEIEIMKMWTELGPDEPDAQASVVASATEEHRARQRQRVSMMARLQIS